MSIEGEEHRRHPRLPVACRVELHDRFTKWSCETMDVGPRGCRIVTSRAPVVGALLRLGIASERVPDPLEVSGQVAWVLKGPKARVGISFLGRGIGERAGPVEWFFGLVGAEIAEAAGRGEVGPPLGGLMVYLGAPPPSEVHAPEEREVIGRVGEGIRLAELVARSASGAVEALMRRGWLTLARANAVPPERWLPALAGRCNRAAARQRAAADPTMSGAILHPIEVPIEVESGLESAPAEHAPAGQASP